MGGCPVYCRMFRSTSSLYALGVRSPAPQQGMTFKNTWRCCHISWKGVKLLLVENHQLGNTLLAGEGPSWALTLGFFECVLVLGLQRKHKTGGAPAFLGPYSLVQRPDQPVQGADKWPSSRSLQDVERQAGLWRMGCQPRVLNEEETLLPWTGLYSSDRAILIYIFSYSYLLLKEHPFILQTLPLNL